MDSLIIGRFYIKDVDYVDFIDSISIIIDSNFYKNENLELFLSKFSLFIYFKDFNFNSKNLRFL